MLTKQELLEFLAVLLAFVETNALPAARAGQVLGLSRAAMSRWLRLARAARNDGEVATSVYHHTADPILAKLRTLNELQRTRGLYTAIEQEPSAEKVEHLKRALRGLLL